MIRTAYRKIFAAAALLVLALVLCSCGRNDISLAINEDGSIGAQIVYGIDKTMVAGDDVLNQVKDLIKQPLDENKIEYTEKDDGNFAKIIVEKHFENAAALADAAAWQGIPFVPKFTAVPTENAITVTAKDGKIIFDGTLNSDSFGATELLSENKKAFGASVAITAGNEKGNGENGGKNTMKWEGTAEDSVKLELTASYKGADFTEKDAPSAETEAAENQSGSTEQNGASDKKALNKTEKKGGNAGQNYTAALILTAAAAAAAAVIIIKKNRGSKNNPDETCGNADNETEENEE